MNKYLSIFNCKELFQEYYKHGMFHPSGFHEIMPRDQIVFDELNEDVLIGDVWDDYNCKICYHKNKRGIWGRSNFDNSYQLISDSLLEFTEGWYQRNSTYWGMMTSDVIWKETSNFYEINIKRYNWDIQPLLNLVNEFISTDKTEGLYIKAFNGGFEVSSTNSFKTKLTSNLAYVFFRVQKRYFEVYYQSSPSNTVSSNVFYQKKSKTAIESIVEWVKMDWVK